MSTIQFIADTHFGHKRVIYFEGEHRRYDTIEEHDEDLVRLWNNKVSHRDVVYHLGDMAWTMESLWEIVPRLNGRIRLVLGNHDTLGAENYLRAGIESLHGCVAWRRGVLLTHMPTWIDEVERFRWNIHGHRHSNGSPAGWLRHICVSAECVDLTPVSIDELHIPKTD